jgi:hypothetical protein
MIVLNPNETTHVLSVIPRYYDITNTHTLTLHNEDATTTTNENQVMTIDFRELSDGKIHYTFDLSVNEGVSYSFDIYDSKASRYVYRGKIFCTTQTPQKYNINE